MFQWLDLVSIASIPTKSPGFRGVDHVCSVTGRSFTGRGPRKWLGFELRRPTIGLKSVYTNNIYYIYIIYIIYYIYYILYIIYYIYIIVIISLGQHKTTKSKIGWYVTVYSSQNPCFCSQKAAGFLHHLVIIAFGQSPIVQYSSIDVPMYRCHLLRGLPIQTVIEFDEFPLSIPAATDNFSVDFPGVSSGFSVRSCSKQRRPIWALAWERRRTRERRESTHDLPIFYSQW